MSLQGKTALVTGGGRGIGRAIAERLAREGARVVVAGRTQAELDAVASSIGGVAMRLDVSDREALPAALLELGERAGRIDILVNNAGAAESAPLERTTDAIWDRMLAVNVTGAFALCRALVPPMIEATWGRVVNVASNAGLTGYAYSSAYCAAKHAVVGMTRALALELGTTGVTINAVCPGWVDTQLAGEAVERIARTTGRSPEQARASLERMSPQRRMIATEEVANLVAVLASDEARGLHGQAIALDGGQVLA